jgi:antitoxin (DNA-binding transcriptional repressor) of toxin-antitoxin stability system
MRRCECMVTIDVGDFEKHPAEVVRQVRSGQTVQLVEGGRAVGTITPVTPVTAVTPIQRPYSEEQAKAFLDELERMATEIGKYLPKQVDAVEAVREIRREL